MQGDPRAIARPNSTNLRFFVGTARVSKLDQRASLIQNLGSLEGFQRLSGKKGHRASLILQIVAFSFGGTCAYRASVPHGGPLQVEVYLHWFAAQWVGGSFAGTTHPRENGSVIAPPTRFSL